MKSFENLRGAGEKLAALVKAEYSHAPDVILAVIPNGVPVALPVGRELGVPVRGLPVHRTADGPVVFEVPPIPGLHVIVIDDGVETGAVARVVAAHLLKGGPASLTLAVPVCPRQSLAELALRYDQIIAIDKPLVHRSLAWHYLDFDTITETSALQLLANQ
ncbi:MAG: phosphoribosyltransferase family protein [Actinomycetota bacterium]|nr:phosphoribosyltransferase family protein [Actinomycetota bacterium]